MKKIKMGILLLALLLLFMTSAYAADATLRMTAPVGEIKAGESFTVSVELENNPGFTILQFLASYDKNTMTCDAAKGGGLLQSAMYLTNPQNDDGVAVAAVNVTPIAGNGQVLRMRFTAKEDLRDPDFTLTDMVMVDGEGGDRCG